MKFSGERVGDKIGSRARERDELAVRGNSRRIAECQCGHDSVGFGADESVGSSLRVPQIHGSVRTCHARHVCHERHKPSVRRHVQMVVVLITHEWAVGVGVDQISQTGAQVVTKNDSARGGAGGCVGDRLECHVISIGAEAKIAGDGVGAARDRLK